MDNNLTPEQTQAGLDKIAKGDMPDSTNITKVIVDGLILPSNSGHAAK
ncbi:hypothetical protein [Escherichia coli]|nr:hypothetical protein [Escherichia coli]